MVKIEGLYNTAFCYTPVLEDVARAQIQSVCDQKEFAELLLPLFFSPVIVMVSCGE